MPMRRITSTLVFVLGIAVAPSALGATTGNSSDAAGFVQQMVGQATDSMRNTALSDGERDQRIVVLLQTDFDLHEIARFVLGRYWTTANETERQTFDSLFPRWVLKTYSARLKQLCDQSIKVTGSRMDDGTNATVTSEIANGSGSPVKIDWRLGDHGAGFKVTDISVEGVSLLLSQREEVASVISRTGGSLATLNGMLAQKLQAATGF